MFFTVFGYNSPRIERAGLDGSNRQVVVSDKVVYPVGLALDLANSYIYWIGLLSRLCRRRIFKIFSFFKNIFYFIFVIKHADTYLDVIERASYDGTKRKTVKKGYLVREHDRKLSHFNIVDMISTLNVLDHMPADLKFFFFFLFVAL